MPFFSIITVCYNSEKTIEKTLQSVLSQTEQDFEYILIDGASLDSTVDIIRAWEPMFGGRMKVISEPDGGIYDAMNKGIRMAQGILVGIVNSDDFYQNNTLELVKAHFNPNLRYQILYGAQNNIDDDGEITTIEFVHHKNLPQRMINHPTCFVSKSIYQDKGLYSLDYVSVSDYDFMLKMYYDSEVSFLPIHEVLSNFYVGGVSSSTKSHLETFKLWRNYGCITRTRYWLITLSTLVKKVFAV